MPKIYYGCDHVPRGWGRYYAMCTAIELDIESFEAEPKQETLNRWRVESPKGFAFLPHLRHKFVKELQRLGRADAQSVDDALREAWQTSLSDAHALAARALFLKTPLSFSPSPTNRLLIQSVGEELVRKAKPSLIWESQGMWPVEESRALAQAAGMMYAFDPFLAMRENMPPTHGDACFILTERAGMRREFDAFDIEQMLEWADNYDRLFIILRGRFQWNHARVFKEVLGEEG